MKKLLIVALALAFVCAVSLPAMAQEKTTDERLKYIEECLECLWKFYGSARMATFWESDDEVAATATFDDDDLTWDYQSNSRIGAKAKIGDIGGHFEYGYTTQGMTSHQAVRVRILIGTWNFGAGQILLGQTYTPTFCLMGNQVWGEDDNLGLHGGFLGSGGRFPMIQLTMGGFNLALIKPSTTATLAQDETDTSIPKIEASYQQSIGPVFFKIAGGYNTLTEVDRQVFPTEVEYDVDSWIIGAMVKFSAGPVTVGVSYYTAQNAGNYGSPYLTNYDTATMVGTQVYDSDTYGVAAYVSFKINDMVTMEAGYGFMESSSDRPGVYEDDNCSYYLNATINIAKGFFIVPEIGVNDNKDIVTDGVTTEEVKTTYFGAKWQINF